MTNKLVIDIVRENISTSKVFFHYGIDYCCNGTITLAEAIKDLEVDMNTVINELKKHLSDNLPSEENMHLMMPDELIEIIKDKHHGYLHLNLPLIHESGQIAVRENPKEAKVLVDLLSAFVELRDSLNKNIFKEDNIIFPYILNITEAYKNDLKIDIAPFRKITNALNFMELENNKTHMLMSKIRTLSNNYLAEPSSSKICKLFYSKLKEMEEEIYIHLYIQNHTLFPKAIELENAVSGTVN